MKERIYSLDFVRVFSCFAIVLMHYVHYSNCQIMKNIEMFGSDSFVYVFLLLSGYTLFYNHTIVSDIKKFYFSRFKTIYPMFYIAYFVFFYIAVIQAKHFFCGFKIIFSFLGLDGYLSYKYSTYYLIGECFLGAIIICYFLYPFLNKILNSKKIFFKNLFFLFLFFGSISSFLFYRKFFDIYPSHNIFTVLFCFYIGMVVSKLNILNYFRKKYFYYLLIFLCFALICEKLLNILGIYNINVPIYKVRDLILGVVLFITLYFLGQNIMNNNFLKRIILFISSITYPVYLVHHKMISYVLSCINSSKLSLSFFYFFVTCNFTIIFSYFLKSVVTTSMEDISKLFIKSGNSVEN